MKPTRKINRRSFLGQVAGGAALSGGLLTIGNDAGAVQTSDCDRGAGADPGGRPSGRSVRSGATDSDDGATADPPGCGRRSQPSDWGSTGLTDRDPVDRAGYGRGGGGARVHTGVTDSDSGANADPAGGGRGSGSSGSGGADCSVDRRRQQEIAAELRQHPFLPDADYQAMSADLQRARALYAEQVRIRNDPNLDILNRERQADAIIEELAEIGYRWGMSRQGEYTVQSLENRLFAADQAQPRRAALEEQYRQLEQRILQRCG